VNWLHIQDSRGTTSEWGEGAVTGADVREWYLDIGILGLWDSFRVNMEMFKANYQPLTPYEFAVRETEYTDLQIGASWELRYWWPSHDYTPPTPALTTTTSSEDLLWHGSATTQRANNVRWRNRKQVRTWLDSGALTGQYANRAYVTDLMAAEVRDRFGLEVQGDRYMRPYAASVVPGRIVNSDHLTAGALDIFFRTAEAKKKADAVRAYLDPLEKDNVVRYYMDLGSNAAHNNHIHVSLQLGVY